MSTITRAEAEDLLFLEADLLDQWKLDDWLLLFTADASYEVPSTDLPPGADAAKTLFYIADDHERLVQRVTRLNKKTAHSEWPRSKTRHLVSNVRVGLVEGDETAVSAAFVTFRSKNGHTDTYMGRSLYRLTHVDGALRIRAKRCELDLDGLRPHGRVSILL